MTTGRDDDALSWGGDDDPTLDVGSGQAPASGAEPPAEPVVLPDGFEAVGRGSDSVARAESDASDVLEARADEPAPVGNAMLITLGAIAGVFLLYTIGWVIGGLRLQGQRTYLVADVMFQGSLWLAVLAPALWFGTVYLLTRSSAAWVRIVWLVAGALLLVPWPFIMTGAVGL